jgi:hypothetical protein
VIPHPRGWSKAYSGDVLTLYHPDGPAAGAIRYRERVRPLVPARVAVEELLGRTPRFAEPVLGKLESGVTAEGEYAAYVPIAGRVEGRPAHRAVGLVFGDDFYALLSGLCLATERVAEFTRLFRLLVHADSLGLGVRRRRYLYTPPPGWQGQARGLTTEWTPPGYPRAQSLIQVYPANPAAVELQVVFEQMLAEDRGTGFVVDKVVGPHPAGSAHGLIGKVWTVTGRFADRKGSASLRPRAGGAVAAPGPPAERNLVVFKDAHYRYALRFETLERDKDTPRQRFVELVRSVRPIPTGSVAGTKPNDLVGHWAL